MGKPARHGVAGLDGGTGDRRIGRIHTGDTRLTSPGGTDFILVAGARPNFVKLAPLDRAMRSRGMRFLTVHTGQHYDDAMSGSFFRELEIPEPDINLEVGSASHAVQTARIMIGFEGVIEAHQPKWVVVFGDVNSTIACALVASKLDVNVAHVEAGVRSRDWAMPEEVNRVVTDTLSQRLYSPSQHANANLAQEGIPLERVCLAGNIMVDTLRQRLPKLDSASALERFGVGDSHFILATLHRASNVDDAATLRRLCDLLEVAGQTAPVLFPVHPRTRDRLARLVVGGSLRNVTLLEPLPYGTFLGLMSRAQCVVTDSGGVQVETSALGIPCVTVRDTTEWPETILEGTNALVPIDSADFKGAIASAGTRKGRIPKFWDGCAAERIADDLRQLT